MIDCYGLNLSDRIQIGKIGFWPWFHKACDAQEKRLNPPKPSLQRRKCEVCGKKFPFKRASKKTCSALCRQHKVRRGV